MSLQLEKIARRKIKRPQPNDFTETLLDEHFRVEERRTWFDSIKEMQVVLGKYLFVYNHTRPQRGAT